jgi:hypothetical protein
MPLTRIKDRKFNPRTHAAVYVMNDYCKDETHNVIAIFEIPHDEIDEKGFREAVYPHVVQLLRNKFRNIIRPETISVTELHKLNKYLTENPSPVLTKNDHANCWATLMYDEDDYDSEILSICFRDIHFLDEETDSDSPEGDKLYSDVNEKVLHYLANYPFHETTMDRDDGGIAIISEYTDMKPFGVYFNVIVTDICGWNLWNDID